MKSINATLRSETRRFFYNLVLFLLGIYPLFLLLFLIQHISDIIIFDSGKTFNERLSELLILISWLEIGLGMFLMMHLITYKFPTRWVGLLDHPNHDAVRPFCAEPCGAFRSPC